MPQRQLRLAAFMRPASIHTGAWRYPGAFPDANFNLTHIKSFAQKLAQAKFDASFMADHLAVRNMPMDALSRSHTVTPSEPFMLLAVLAIAPDRIGPGPIGPTTFDAARALAAETAVMVFTAQNTLDAGRAFYADVKARMEKAGRKRDQMKIMPACFVVVGATMDDAKEKRARLDSLVDYANAIGSLS